MTEARCRACGRPIVWMKTKTGKTMPCDAQLKLFWQSEEGSQRVLTHAGELVRCELIGNADESTGLGRTPHWGNCTQPDQFRKRGKTL